MNTEIHRLLDELFAGFEMTPERQDFKEELRGNLMARVDELEAAGIPPGQAAQRAVTELGDPDELLGELLAESPGDMGQGGDTPGGRSGDGQGASRLAALAALAERHRVRPKPGFVVRAVLWSILVVLGLALSALGAVGVLSLGIGPVIGLLGLAATGAGLLVGDSLSQETSANYPLPERRAAGFAGATFLSLYGLGFAAFVAAGALPAWCVVFAVAALAGGIVLFTFLGATRTNRKKPWVRHLAATYQVSRFEREPEVAARFGMYAGAIWILVGGVTLVVGFTAGWMWAGLPGLAGVAAMLLLLARMQFRAE